ncbi:MAG: hypothetical protein ACKVP2_09535 [Burkholderiales bacterium]
MTRLPRRLPAWIGIGWLVALPATLQAGAGNVQEPNEQESSEARPAQAPVMKREMAVEYMGTPMDVTKFTDPEGREVEDWVYPNGQWLRFVDGKLKNAGSTDWTPRFPEIPTEVFNM